jgi:hypothetical protein
MKQDDKYYGEVWFDDNDKEKKFAVLLFENNEILIETNLYSPQGAYKEPHILGSFNGLGYITFIDCQTQQSATGLINSRIYNPTYCFIGLSHFVNPYKLKINQFDVVNEAIVKWIDHRSFYNWNKKEIVSKDFKNEFYLPDKGIKIVIEQYLNYRGSGYEIKIENKGKVSFQTEKPVDILEAIKFYDQFQKVLQLLRGGSAQFEKFLFKCPSCDDWQEIYYNDKKLTKSKNTYVHTSYSEVKDDLEKILKGAYSLESFQFCLDKLMENFITRESSHNKRFTNSIAAFEAFLKNYNKKSNFKLVTEIRHHKDLFMRIGDMSEDEWKEFPNKVVRSRNYHSHSNLGNREIFTEYQLLYISLLFDFVIGYLLLETIGVSKTLLQKFVQQGKSVYVDMQWVNSIFSSNPLISKKK